MHKVVNDKLAYLDTCVISGLAKNVLEDSESGAMVALLSDYESKSFRFVTSSKVLDELNQIPNKKDRTSHLTIYHLLSKVRALPDPSITRMGLDGGIARNPDREVWSSLRAIVPDENDANHLYQAIQNGARFFVTVDFATILRYKSEIDNKFNIIACRPSELFQVARQDNINERAP